MPKRAPVPVPSAGTSATDPAVRARLLGQPRVQLDPPQGAEDAAAQPGAVTVNADVLGPRRVPPRGAATSGTTVALLVPLSGDNAKLGRGLLRAAQMGVFDAAEGDFTLRPYDTAGPPEAARAAAETALADGAELILGPVFAENVVAAGEPVRRANVPMIAFSTDRTVAGDGVYTMGFLPETQVRRMAAYAREQGHRRFAVLAPDTAYGLTVMAALQEIFRNGPGELVRVGTFDPDLDGIRGQIRQFTRYERRQNRIQQRRRALQARRQALSQHVAYRPVVPNIAAHPGTPVPVDQLTERAVHAELVRLANRDTAAPPPYDALFLPAGGDRLLTVAPLLPFFDVPPERVQFLGTGLWDDADRGFEPALAGAWYPASPPERRQRLRMRYEELYADRPQRLATLAYDAVALAAFLARSDSGGHPYRQARLERPAGFMGRDGLFRFRRDGTVERKLAIFEIGPKQDRVRDPAPRRFDTPGGRAGS